ASHELSSSSSSSSSIWWLGFEDEDEQEDELVHGPKARQQCGGAGMFGVNLEPANGNERARSASQSAGQGDVADPCGHNHGRQRALGQATPSAARRRPPTRRRVCPRGRPRGRRGGREISYALRIFGRELESSQGRRGHVDEVSGAFPQKRTGGAERQPCGAGSDRADLSPGGIRPGAVEENRGGAGEKQRTVPDSGFELRRPHGGG